MPMSSPTISRMFGREDLPLPGVPGLLAENMDIDPTISAARTANLRNVIITALWVIVLFSRVAVILILLRPFIFTVNFKLAAYRILFPDLSCIKPKKL
jgi:hypothetical protein